MLYKCKIVHFDNVTLIYFISEIILNPCSIHILEVFFGHITIQRTSVDVWPDLQTYICPTLQIFLNTLHAIPSTQGEWHYLMNIPHILICNKTLEDIIYCDSIALH